MLPPRTIAAVVTFLEVVLPLPERPGTRRSAAIAFDPILPTEPERFARLFRTIGKEWMWTSRVAWSAEEIAERLANPGVECYAIVVGGADVGLIEVDVGTAESLEIVLYGLVPEAVGRGIGVAAFGDLLDRLAARPGARRIWLHTCTLDHPKALGFYRSFGFAVFARAIEIGADPRLSGDMAFDAGPTHPPIP